VFDTIVRKDRGSRLVARAIAYGPDARQRLDVCLYCRHAEGNERTMV